MEIKMDNKVLKKLKQIFKKEDSGPSVSVGVLGGSARKTGGSTNAEIGATHEFGSVSKGIVRRSWLRVPVTEHLQDYLLKNGIDEGYIAKCVKSGSIEPLLGLIGTSAVNVIMDGFDSGGFGKWAKWKNPGYSNKTGMILVDERELRDSIYWEIAK